MNKPYNVSPEYNQDTYGDSIEALDWQARKSLALERGGAIGIREQLEKTPFHTPPEITYLPAEDKLTWLQQRCLHLLLEADKDFVDSEDLFTWQEATREIGLWYTKGIETFGLLSDEDIVAAKVGLDQSPSLYGDAMRWTPTPEYDQGN